MRIILCDNRTFIGTFSAYDKHMNIVLTNCAEYKNYVNKRKITIKGKKTIGTAIIRGENIVSVIVETLPEESRSAGSSSRRSRH
ncbi:small nuclear ribonucleoprotein-associated protein B isoform X3 [Parasteatoda tepidariorum]